MTAPQNTHPAIPGHLNAAHTVLDRLLQYAAGNSDVARHIETLRNHLFGLGEATGLLTPQQPAQPYQPYGVPHQAVAQPQYYPQQPSPQQYAAPPVPQQYAQPQPAPQQYPQQQGYAQPAPSGLALGNQAAPAQPTPGFAPPAAPSTNQQFLQQGYAPGQYAPPEGHPAAQPQAPGVPFQFPQV